MTVLDAQNTRHPGTAHEHAWLIQSRHLTSTGYVLYVRCERCGTYRVDVQDHAEAPPRALSRPVCPLRDPVGPVGVAAAQEPT